MVMHRRIPTRRDIRQSLVDIQRGSTYAQHERGRLGRLRSDGSFVIDVPGKPGYVYVRIFRGADQTLTEAIYASVPKVGNYPIILGLTSSGERIIIGGDADVAIPFLSGAGTVLQGDVGPHSHRLGLGYDDMVEGLRMEPGVVLPTDGTSMYVTVYPFFYVHEGQHKFFPGTSIDLYGEKPASGHWWAKVYVDPATNTAGVATMAASHDLVDELDEDDLADIDVTSLIPLGGVQLRWDQTEVRYLNKMVDCRAWNQAVTAVVPVPRGQSLWSFEGNIEVGNNPLPIYNRTGSDKTIEEVFLSAGTGPTGSAIIVDVNKDGTTIFTNQAHRPQIAAGQTTGYTDDIDVPVWGNGSYLTVDVDQIGSGVPGANVVVHVVYY